jgi:rRNA maturation RNase YbeY
MKAKYESRIQSILLFLLNMPINFHKSDIAFRLQRSADLKIFLKRHFFLQTSKKLSLNCVFCSDAYLLQINKDFLNHDYYTDIITFPLEETETSVDAEIYISVDRVKDNASTLKAQFNMELQRVIFHGVLHLCGFDDKTKKQQAIMQKMEDEWIEKFELFML